MNASSGDYGIFAGLVATAGTLLSATAALILTWKRRARWEPSEEDIPKGAQRTGGLVIAVVIGIAYFWLRGQESALPLTKLSLVSAGIAFVALLLYSILVGVFTYEQVFSPSPNIARRRKIIGGFRLTQAARTAVRTRNITVQEALAGAAYDLDKVWSRISRALAKATFLLSYILLVAGGTLALAFVSLLLQIKTQ